MAPFHLDNMPSPWCIELMFGLAPSLVVEKFR